MHAFALMCVAAGLLVLFFGPSTRAAETKVMFGGISYPDLKRAILEKKVVLLDCNGSEMFAKVHIPGALDFESVKSRLAEVLPRRKDALIVSYCGNEKCPAYLEGAQAASVLGYTNVRHFAPGIEGWNRSEHEALSVRFPRISHSDLRAAMDAKRVVLLDCNGSEMFAKSHIPGALDFEAVKSRLADVLPKDKDTLIVSYCGSEKCLAFARAAEAAAALGYKNVKHFAPGIKGWEKAQQEGLRPAALEDPPMESCCPPCEK